MSGRWGSAKQRRKKMEVRGPPMVGGTAGVACLCLDLLVLGLLCSPSYYDAILGSHSP